MSIRSLTSILFAPAFLAAFAGADTIHTTDGKAIADCTVLEEGLMEVTYRRSSNNNKVTMPASEVLRIDFTTRPIDRTKKR